jgi:flagellum-specific peptidoglycan hydrolase FlgJ
MEKKDFKTKIMSSALSVKDRTGIAPVITITQAAHESRWGNSGLTEQANNLFGYTAGSSWGGSVYSMPSTEYSPFPPEKIRYWNKPGDIISKEASGKGSKLTVAIAFRKYKDWNESVNDWADNISTRSQYSKAYAFAKFGDVAGYAQAIQEAGYATDPNYAKSLLTLSKEVENV